MSGPMPVPALGNGEVHVWWIPLDDVGDDGAAILPPADLARARRIRHAHDRNWWIAARMALRQILAGYTGIAPTRLAFRRGRWGKPELDYDAAPWRFNLTHAGNRATLAVAWEKEVGIDLEPIDPSLDLALLIAAICTPAEAGAVCALPEGERVMGLLTLWTQKEAYLKGTGEGFSRDPRTIDIGLGHAGSVSLRDRDLGALVSGWRLLPLDGGSGWIAALAATQPVDVVRDFNFPPAIMNDCPEAS